MIADLAQIKENNDIVFNLCDEGFDNRAKYELHVPALFEISGIEYTGGTPRCLAFCYDKSLVRGIAKELEIGFIGNMPNDLAALPIIEEDYSSLPKDLPKICGYEAKWDPTSRYWNLKSIPADLSLEVESFLITSCRRLFERLECRDYARFDWRLDAHGTPRLLEANPNSGWCWDGHLAKMAALENCNYPGMLKSIVDAGIRRVSE